jgi:tetratricopeptide (TPR) repeat protein
MDQWEKFVVSGCLSLYRGNFLKAGNLFENALLSGSPADPLLLKLSQNAYLSSSFPEHSLSCLLRFPRTFHQEQQFRSAILSYLSMGYSENGKFPEAEESSSKAVEMASLDIHPILSLCASYYYQGKATDIIECYKKVSSLFEDESLHRFSCWRSHAFIMRGNCMSAFNGLFQICEAIAGNDVRPSTSSVISSASTSLLSWFSSSSSPASSSTPSATETVPSVVEASVSFPCYFEMIMLLWQINLHISSRHVLAIDSVVNPLSRMLEEYSLISIETKYLCKVILLAVELNALETRNSLHQLNLYEKELKDKIRTGQVKSGDVGASNYLDTIVKSRAPVNRFGKPPGVTVEENDFKISQDIIYDEKSLDRMKVLKSELNGLLTSLDNIYLQENTNVEEFCAKFPVLSNTLPELVFFPYSDSTMTSKLDKYVDQRKQFYYSLTLAIIHFALRDNVNCHKILSKESYQGYRHFGNLSVHKDIIHQMYVER